MKKQQGRIHGQYQSRMGGQGRKRWFFHFSTCAHQRTDRRTDGRTDKASYRVARPRLKNHTPKCQTDLPLSNGTLFACLHTLQCAYSTKNLYNFYSNTRYQSISSQSLNFCRSCQSQIFFRWRPWFFQKCSDIFSLNN